MSEPQPLLWLLLGSLVVLSGSFSASETALFRLSANERALASRRAKALLSKPRELLVSILLGNLVTNLFYFSFATRLRIAEEGSLASGAVVLAVLLVFGEVLPKTLALRAPTRVVRWTALPLSVFVRLTQPLRRGILSFLELGRRFLGQSEAEEASLTPEILDEVLSRAGEVGELERIEAEVLSEIVELGGTRVREIMTPRVDVVFLDVQDADHAPQIRAAIGARLPRLPVVDGDADHILGCVRVRELLRRPDRPLEECIMPIKFVPEVAGALDLLAEFKRDRAAEAIVVDEWGGTAGIVTVEDIFEELVGELRTEGEEREPPVIPLGEGRFRVAGSLTIRDWNVQFGQRVVPTEFETVGGMVTALLGRIPRVGDRIRVGPLVCEVTDVRGRRVVSVDMHVDLSEDVS
jgi:CBS domain containing-hemolysin-like protein